jgi:predicted TIM-barrel fold metal-dependent hydrolase
MAAQEGKGQIGRRDFLKSSLISAAAAPLLAIPAAGVAAGAAPQPQADPPGIIDTNVHLFDWPFRRLKYGQTAALITKLKKHRVVEAWAGSFEALLHKNLDTVNRRLAEECQQKGRGFLRPVGSVCPAWPGWEEDLRRCQEAYQMPGIRLYPGYHNYRLDLPEFTELLVAAAQRGLFVQIAMEMEDSRVHHPALNLATVVAAPLTDALKKVPHTRVQLLNGLTALQQGGAQGLVSETKVTLDIANLEGAGAVGRLIDGKHWSIKTQVPLARLMFGSHAPFFPFEAALLRLFESPLDREQMTAIMHENARQWLVTESAQ